MAKRERSPGLVAGPTLLDRLIGYVEPRVALERMKARAQLGALSAFTAGGQGRGFGGWRGTVGSADADLLPELWLQRDRSRDAIRNIPLATGAVRSQVTAVVGSGLQLQSQVDADALGWTPDEADAWQRTTEREFNLWAESTDCDITRHDTFYGLQGLTLMSMLENGDCLTLLPLVARKGSRYDLRLQTVEADRLRNTDGSPDTPTQSGGVKMDAYGAPIAYQITRQHPGSFYSTGLQWDEYPAFSAKTGRRNVLHHFIRLRPGQSRGVPYLSPVMEAIKQLGRYSEAEIMSAVVAGMFTVFVTSEGSGLQGPLGGTPSGTPGADGEDSTIAMGNGNIVDLLPGEKVEAPNPGRPNPNFDPFFQAIVRQIAMGLEIPYEVLIKHFTASYSASRAAMVDAWKFYLGRRAWLAQSFCNPVYEAWMEEAVSSGYVKAPGFFTDLAARKAYLGARWQGEAMPAIDPVKEVNAAETRVAAGFSDRQRETAFLTGGDWETTHRQQVREKKMRDADGLSAPPPSATQKQIDQTEQLDGGSDLETVPPAPGSPAPAKTPPPVPRQAPPAKPGKAA
jgi:lambda family phage portal protein